MITHYYIHALEQQIYPARLYVMQGLTLCIDASNVFLCLYGLICLQNLKMKISHPRFLNIGKRESLNREFPACLEKTNSDHSGVPANPTDVSHSMFLFPEVSTILS